MQLQEQVFWEASPEGMGIKQVPALGILGAGHDGVLFFFFCHMLQIFYDSISPTVRPVQGGRGGALHVESLGAYLA